ncbi:MAG: Gfo/Idh/MocA family protein [Rhodoglobus sp.]
MTGVAIVGRGFMGKTHVSALATLGRAHDVRYIVARSGGEPVENAPAAKVVADFDIALNDPAVSVVSICTPTGTHRELAVRALRAGKNVLLEKPIALTLSDGLAIQHEAALAGTTFMVAQVVRFFDGYRQLRHDVAAGKVGRALSVRASRFGIKPDWADWLRDYAGAGGMLVDFGIHDFDQVNLFLGEPVHVSVAGSGTFGPLETTVTYRGGGIGQVLSYADTPEGLPFRSSLEILGTDGVARYDFAAETEKTNSTDSSVFDEVSRYTLAAKEHDTTMYFDPHDPYARQFDYFFTCVETGAQPGLCTTPSAQRALEVALAAQQSCERQTPVSIASRVANDEASGETGLPWNF